MRRASDLIHKQDPVKVNQALLRQASPDQLHIIVSLPKQRAYLMVDQRAKNYDVENVIDAIRASGIWNVGLLVEQDQSAAARP